MRDRDLVETWLRAGLVAVDAEKLTEDAISGFSTATVIAIGKAAPAMCRGAAAVIGAIDGLCVANHEAPVPPSVELVLGDHPVPGPASFAAGEKALAMAPHANLALISGGGSALCEWPRPGIDPEFLATANRALVACGVSIEEMNLVRGHLSAIKRGGLGPLPTYLLSDVGGFPPAVVSSGPTFPGPHEPERVIEILHSIGLSPSHQVMAAIRAEELRRHEPELVAVVGDGRTAARGVLTAIAPQIAPARMHDSWLEGEVAAAVDSLLSVGQVGVTVATGETVVAVSGIGRGGRNTHAALLAARAIAGTGSIFAALATDGVDGTSGAAGAIVDGETISRGGDPSQALESFDSASYLRRTGDLLRYGPTGTNVADLWLIWVPR